MEQSGFISQKGSYKLHYQVYGEGEKNILCFHGFGQNSSAFKNLGKKYPNTRIVSLDLPFHGNTQFPHKHLTKALWNDVTKDIFTHFEIEKTDILAYSLGGRFAIQTIMNFPEKISTATFIAADGFYFPKIYHIATSWPGKYIFKLVVSNPRLLFVSMEKFAKYGLTNQSMVKFTYANLTEQKQRDRAYASWNYLKPLRTSVTEFAFKLKSKNIPTHLYIGKKDYVIKENFFDHFVKIHPQTNKIVLNKRHHEMIDAFIYNDK